MMLICVHRQAQELSGATRARTPQEALRMTIDSRALATNDDVWLSLSRMTQSDTIVAVQLQRGCRYVLETHSPVAGPEIR
jgi:hypothetical protein